MRRKFLITGIMAAMLFLYTSFSTTAIAEEPVGNNGETITENQNLSTEQPEKTEATAEISNTEEKPQETDQSEQESSNDTASPEVIESSDAEEIATAEPAVNEDHNEENQDAEGISGSDHISDQTVIENRAKQQIDFEDEEDNTIESTSESYETNENSKNADFAGTLTDAIPDSSLRLMPQSSNDLSKNELQAGTVTLDDGTTENGVMVYSRDDIVNAVDEAGNGETVNIILGTDIKIGPLISIDKSKNVTIFGENHTLINLSGNELFQVYGSLTLGGEKYSKGLVLRAVSADNPLVTINQSILNMFDGVTLMMSARTGNGGAGGVQASNGATFDMYGGTITDCVGEFAGGVLMDGSTFNMHGGAIDNCSATHDGDGYGGGIVLLGHSIFNMTGGTIKNCKGWLGGAIGAISSTVHIENSQLQGNSASLLGGAILLDDSELELSDSVEIENNSAVYGGAIYAQNYSRIAAAEKANVLIQHNTAGIGGGIVTDDGTAADLSKVIICNNRASSAASDVYATESSTMSLPSASDMKQIYEADGNDKYIEGWYRDYSPRYVPSEDGKTVDVSDPKAGYVLVASYKKRRGLEVKAENYNDTYDGLQHTVENTDYKVTYTGQDCPPVEDEVTYLYSADKQTWVSNKGELFRNKSAEGVFFKNASPDSNKVYIKAHSHIYEDSEPVERTVTINKRRVVLTSGSAEKKDDGIPLTNNEINVSGDGFVNGEEPSYNITGSQAGIGSCDNSFEVVWKNENVDDNYEVTTKFGTLSVHGGRETVVTPVPLPTDSPKETASPSSASASSVTIKPVETITPSATTEEPPTQKTKIQVVNTEDIYDLPGIIMRLTGLLVAAIISAYILKKYS